jgi:hypothetical protein
MKFITSTNISKSIPIRCGKALVRAIPSIYLTRPLKNEIHQWLACHKVVPLQVQWEQTPAINGMYDMPPPALQGTYLIT